MSASTGIAAVKSRSSTSSRSISNSADSALSTSTSRAAPSRDELAAELRADRAAGARDEHGLSCTYDATSRRSTSTCSRPSTSSTCTGPDLRAEVEVAGDQLVQARQRLDRRRARRGTSRRSSGARVPAPTGSRSAPRRACCRAGGARARRSCRAPSPRGCGRRACAGRRRRSRSACSASCRLRCSSRTISWPGVAGADDQHLLAVRDEPGRRPLDQRAREQTRAGDEGEQQQEVERGDAARQPRGVHGRERVEHEVGEQRARP